ncbi:hypothetical protein Acr_28g0009440 [Actinidia rufa]|uniref:Uncharacterized protein n=1 Tax=Actinidia rufa TaxID=165716 RepID=A0A7J0HAY9_9ERIC|nr:hypothetical protein Acr_28g0009440 [Actinidia rufa]
MFSNPNPKRTCVTHPTTSGANPHSGNLDPSVAETRFEFDGLDLSTTGFDNPCLTFDRTRCCSPSLSGPPTSSTVTRLTFDWRSRRSPNSRLAVLSLTRLLRHSSTALVVASPDLRKALSLPSSSLSLSEKATGLCRLFVSSICC